MISKRLTAVYIVFILMASIFPTISGSGGIPPAEASGFEPLFSGGNGTAGNPYKISNVTELQWMGNTSNLDKHFILINDIDASATKTWNSGAGFVPVGTDVNVFTGSLDGKGYNITGLFINRSGTDYQGLFGYVERSGVVNNVSLIDNDVTGRDYVGGLIGNNQGNVMNCTAQGDTNGRERVGGLVGYNSGGTVTNCYAAGDVSGTSFVGGLIGYNLIGMIRGTVTGCSAQGNTTGNFWVGGLIGYNSGILTVVTGCIAQGNTTGDYYVGGLIGYTYFGTVTECSAQGTTTGSSSSVGGLIGYNDRGTVTECSAQGTTTGSGAVGGLIGYNDRGTVTVCSAQGNTTGNLEVGGLIGRTYFGTVTGCSAEGNTNGSVMVGGLIGENYFGTVRNCYAVGNTSGTDRVGGLVGRNNDGTVTNCYATGNVSGSSEVGGLVGRNEGTVMKGNFWDNQTSGQTSTDGNATGKNTTEMMKIDMYKNAGWDIIHIIDHTSEAWYIDEGYDYPRLGWEEYVDRHPPMANAGPDQVVDEGTTVTFDGSGSMDNIGIANWTWTFFDGESITLSGSRPEYLFNDPGIFIVTLNVTDATGNWNEDTMNVTVIDITPPVADAGPDMIVNEGSVVVFNGSGSSDNAGIATWTWTFNDGVENITLYGSTPSHAFNVVGIYEVTLNVTDAAGHWATDMMIVTVKDITPPVANAGPDQTVDERTLVLFNGSGSYDNVGIANWTWTFIDIGPITLYGARPEYLFNDPGIFIVTLNVTDEAGNWFADSMTVAVIDIIRPIADAGSDQIVDEGSLVSFDGSGSTDNVWVINWTWTFFDGNENITIFGPTPSYIFTVPGIYNVTLNVTDAAGHWTTDTMTVTVNDITRPVADAGSDLVVEVGTTVIFDGIGSYDNIGIVNYTWTFMDGIPIALYGSQAEHEFIVPGIFIVTLNVSDAAGNRATATVNVTVRDITSPVSNAGSDKRIAVGSTVILNGSLSTDNVGIVRFTWTFDYDGVERTLEGSEAEFKFEKAGTYQIKLMVFDEHENSGEDTVIIIVIDTGIVKGKVLDADGNPVEGALIEITASNGEIHTATTGSDGSFSIEMYHGSFTWEISKDGYEPISGTGSVNALEEITLDLSDTPLVKEEITGTSMIFFIIPIVIIIIILGIAIFLISRRKEEPEE